MIDTDKMRETWPLHYVAEHSAIYKFNLPRCAIHALCDEVERLRAELIQSRDTWSQWYSGERDARLAAEARAERLEAEKLHAIGEYGLAYLRNERLEAALRETARECASSEKESKLEGNRSEAQLFRNIRDFVMEKLDAALATAQPKEADDRG